MRIKARREPKQTPIKIHLCGRSRSQTGHCLTVEVRVLVNRIIERFRTFISDLQAEGAAIYYIIPRIMKVLPVVVTFIERVRIV